MDSEALAQKYAAHLTDDSISESDHDRMDKAIPSQTKLSRWINKDVSPEIAPFLAALVGQVYTGMRSKIPGTGNYRDIDGGIPGN